MIGQTISHYKITEKLGEGGMGAVYRATDSRLGREVALKILPEQFVQDRQRMGRFEREAQVLASLNHPHISIIHGVEESGEARALVLELVEGPTLAEQIAQGSIPIEEALGIALEIAQALEARLCFWRLRRGTGSWLKPLFEKPAEAGSAPNFWRLSGPEGPAYYASRQDAEAPSWIGLSAAEPPVQSVDLEIGKSFFLE